MNQFERNMHILASNLMCRENDPGFGYRIYTLPKEDQARIFRLPRAALKVANDEPMPMTGMFIATAMHPELKQLCLAFSSFPKGGGQSVVHGMLAYDIREISKGAAHIGDYFQKGVVPVADNEFAAET